MYLPQIVAAMKGVLIFNITGANYEKRIQFQQGKTWADIRARP
jgi:hypothetical protein